LAAKDGLEDSGAVKGVPLSVVAEGGDEGAATDTVGDGVAFNVVLGSIGVSHNVGGGGEGVERGAVVRR
jgi:hypothetical protein